MPFVSEIHGPKGNPVYQVGGKSFVFFRTPRPDAVAITVPNDLHSAFAVLALDAGYDVVLEKPLGLDLAQCDAVVAAAARTGRKVAVNHELRVSHQWGRVRELIAEGAIGRVTHQHFSLFRHPFRPGSGGWRRDAQCSSTSKSTGRAMTERRAC